MRKSECMSNTLIKNTKSNALIVYLMRWWIEFVRLNFFELNKRVSDRYNVIHG